ncbi:unnamed protein product [Cyprideis torosa]|uniref:Uncharacterized protein n=1 Tax=Cyprideis torosa TaxID=163714 RepID=A0A7R8ZMD2_9CRUS|nr:unnamed protein product [Cyprideis torosa]CAG0888551.1 unnamed protein product [Cyprideis torosa]
MAYLFLESSVDFGAKDERACAVGGLGVEAMSFQSVGGYSGGPAGQTRTQEQAAFIEQKRREIQEKLRREQRQQGAPPVPFPAAPPPPAAKPAVPSSWTAKGFGSAPKVKPAAASVGGVTSSVVDGGGAAGGPKDIIARRREFQKQLRLQKMQGQSPKPSPVRAEVKEEPPEVEDFPDAPLRRQSLEAPPPPPEKKAKMSDEALKAIDPYHRKDEGPSAVEVKPSRSVVADFPSGAEPSPDWDLCNQVIQDIARGGFQEFRLAKVKHKENPRMWFLYKKDSWAFRIFNTKLQNELAKRNIPMPDLTAPEEGPPTTVGPVSMAIPGPSGASIVVPPSLVDVPTKVCGRSDPELVKYAIRVYGHTDLTEDQWKQCEDQIKLGAFFRQLQQKQKERAKLAQQGKVKYEYDSDEEVDDDEGTWEHRKRRKEMEETKELAEKITQANRGKHHIGDFLPPDELKKFMEKYKALKEGRDFDDSDYAAFKLTAENLGYRMLQKLGWEEGEGLGPEKQGIKAPVNKAKPIGESGGLGLSAQDNLTGDEDEYEAYRKRMMLAYRFRPNPLNNPRRAYY